MFHRAKRQIEPDPGFKIAAGDSRNFGHSCRRFFTQEIETNDIPSLERHSKRFISGSNAAINPGNTHITKANWMTFQKLSKTTTNYRTLTIIVSILVNQVFVLEISICRHSFCSGMVSYVINNATLEEIGETRDSSAAAIQFYFRNWTNFHSRFLCYQCVFDPVPLSTLSLFSCAFATSNLIC